MENMIDIHNFNINTTINKYSISLDRFNSINEFKYFIENVYKIDYLKIEQLMNDYQGEDFAISFNNYLISFVIGDYNNYEMIGYCGDYIEKMKHLEENKKLEHILDNDYDLEDNVFYNLINKHKSRLQIPPS